MNYFAFNFSLSLSTSSPSVKYRTYNAPANQTAGLESRGVTCVLTCTVSPIETVNSWYLASEGLSVLCWSIVSITYHLTTRIGVFLPPLLLHLLQCYRCSGSTCYTTSSLLLDYLISLVIVIFTVWVPLTLLPSYLFLLPGSFLALSSSNICCLLAHIMIQLTCLSDPYLFHMKNRGDDILPVTDIIIWKIVL